METVRSYSMVQKWDEEVKRQGWPVTDTTQETIAMIHNIIIMTYKNVTELYIATEMGISQKRINAVMHNELHMSRCQNVGSQRSLMDLT